MRKPMFQLFANYNQNLNQAMIQAMKQLDTDSLLKNQHAFFGSILGTMNHLMVGDLIWLNRFNQFFIFRRVGNKIIGIVFCCKIFHDILIAHLFEKVKPY